MTKRQRETLDKLIDSFLAEKRVSGGGFALVTEQDYDQLNEIIDTLVALKWSPDPDGDRPINWKLIDRTKFEPMHYFPVPYEHKMQDIHEQNGRLDTLLSNVSLATEALNTTLKIMRLRKGK